MLQKSRRNKTGCDEAFGVHNFTVFKRNLRGANDENPTSYTKGPQEFVRDVLRFERNLLPSVADDHLPNILHVPLHHILLGPREVAGRLGAGNSANRGVLSLFGGAPPPSRSAARRSRFLLFESGGRGR